MGDSSDQDLIDAIQSPGASFTEEYKISVELLDPKVASALEEPSAPKPDVFMQLPGRLEALLEHVKFQAQLGNEAKRAKAKGFFPHDSNSKRRAELDVKGEDALPGLPGGLLQALLPAVDRRGPPARHHDHGHVDRPGLLQVARPLRMHQRQGQFV